MQNDPTGGLIGSLRHYIQAFSRLQIGIHASSASFFLALSVFPALLLLLGLLRHTVLEIRDLLEAMEGFLPEALLPYAEELIKGIYDNTGRGLVSLSAVTALWSASRGVQGLLTGLHAVYGQEPPSGYLGRRLRSLAYTVAFLALLVLTLILHVFGAAMLDALEHHIHPFLRFLANLIDLRFFLLLGLQTALFTAMFTTVDGVKSRTRDSVPGALVASLGWLTFSNLFSLYIDYFGDHTHIYGSVYTAALGMLWLYFCICIVFFGGALNRFLTQR